MCELKTAAPIGLATDLYYWTSHVVPLHSVLCSKCWTCH